MFSFPINNGNGSVCAEDRGVNPFIAFDRECAWGRFSLTSAAATCHGKRMLEGGYERKRDMEEFKMVFWFPNTMTATALK